MTFVNHDSKTTKKSLIVLAKQTFHSPITMMTEKVVAAHRLV